MIFLPYTTEVFVFLQLLGITHANWWWLAFFMLADASTSHLWLQSKGVKKPNIDDKD
jgi:hypothetical protein